MIKERGVQTQYQQKHLNSLYFQKDTDQYPGHTMGNDDPFLTHTCKRKEKEYNKEDPYVWNLNRLINKDSTNCRSEDFVAVVCWISTKK